MELEIIEKQNQQYAGRLEKEIFASFTFYKYLDSGYKKPDISKLPPVNDFDQLLPDSVKRFINQRASSLANSTIFNTGITAAEYSNKQRDLRLHKIEWHKKITLPIACLVLFLIGAPLGSIIRKGGLGLPMVYGLAQQSGGTVTLQSWRVREAPSSAAAS